MKCVILIDSETSAEVLNKLEPDDFTLVVDGDRLLVSNDRLEII